MSNPEENGPTELEGMSNSEENGPTRLEGMSNPEENGPTRLEGMSNPGENGPTKLEGMNNSEKNGPTRLKGKGKAMVACWLLGMATLLPWNSMLTIDDYYYKVFPKYHPSRVLPLVYQPFAVATMVILTYNESRIKTRWRVIAGYIIFFCCTLGLILLDLGTSGKGGVGQYAGLCLLVALFGVADAKVQGGLTGDLAFMLPDFTQSYFAGFAASGALTAGLRLITKAIFDKSHDGLRKGAILFLSISTAIEFVCILLYAFYFPKLPIIKYFRSKAASEGSKTVSSDLAAAGIHQAEDTGKLVDRLTVRQLMHKNWDYFLDLFVIYALTLSIFPGFLYEDTGTHGLGDWYPLVLIATYNVSDLIGRYTPLIESIRLESRKGLMITIFARLILVPAFYVTAKYAGEGWMIMLCFLLGITNGHLTVCVMTVAPKGYKGPEQNALGNLLVLSVLVGLFSGGCLDWLWIIGNGSF